MNLAIILMTPITIHLRHVLYQELQRGCSEQGVKFYMQVDENVPETLSWSDSQVLLINFPSALNWIIRSFLTTAARKGESVLVECKLAPQKAADRPDVLEISVSGEAVVMAREDIERIAKASASPGWLESAIYPSCLWNANDANHPGHSECPENSAFSSAVHSLIAGGGCIWAENGADQETRVILTLPWIERMPVFKVDDLRLSSQGTGDVILAIRSSNVNDKNVLKDILADLGFNSLDTRYECELNSGKGLESVKAVMTTSPDLVEVIRRLPHLQDKPIVLLVQQKRVTRLNVRWCMERHVCSILCYPISHQNTAEALQVALRWHPTLFEPDYPSLSHDILVAEDNVVHQKLITRMLEKLNHKIEIVENGLLAVDAVVDRWYRQRPYDLIMMDTHMPFMNGFDAGVEIRRFEEDQGYSLTPVILLSAGMGIERLQVEWALIFDESLGDALMKPIRRAELRDAIRKNSRREWENTE